MLTGAELSLFPLERTILPRTSTPSVLMFPAALMLFSATILQSITTLALVLLMATWSWKPPKRSEFEESSFTQSDVSIISMCEGIRARQDQMDHSVT